MNQEVKCPCRYVTCRRYGKCGECREHHQGHEKHKEPFCARKKTKLKRKEVKTLKVLYIKANPKPDEESRTFRISEHFIREYKKHHPDDEIITLDLYKENIGFLDEHGVQLKYDPGNADDPMLKYALQFKEADKYVFAEPFWNLGIPAILKAYIDYICITKLTFAYTADGPVGLLKNKKCVNIITRGGAYSEGPYAALEMGDKYLRNILGFLGITDYTTISADMLDIIGVDVESVMQKALKQAEELAKTF